MSTQTDADHGATGLPDTREAVRRWDACDPLAPLRDAFALPAGQIYLDGNSLGALPRETAARVQAVIEAQWGHDLVSSWNRAGWVDLPQRVGDKIGRLIGARPGETLAADSTSINLYKLLAAALRLRPERRCVVVAADEFPTDLYMAEGLLGLLGDRYELRLVEEGASVADAIDRDTAVVVLGHVNYRSGVLYPMAELTEAAHRQGALILWDLAHSAGVIPLSVAADGVDFAVGCGYKYLNGGPGAPAFLYAASAHQAQLSTPLSGWFGHAQPFAFEPRYRGADDIRKLLCGTPPVLALSALEVGVELALQAPMDQVHAKSLRLVELFMGRVRARLRDAALIPFGPAAAAERGSQVCLRHPQAWPIMQALIARGVTGDVRAPDILRFGFAPLYLRYVDVWDAVEHLAEIILTASWDRPEFRAPRTVT
ncbi:MAG: kynureninase [Nevskiales bacterium]|nr:kynureninase [Nevskiales bacterium]